MTQTIKNLAVLVAVLAFAFTMKAEVKGSTFELPHTYKVLTENGQPVWEWEGHSKASLVLVCIIHNNKKEYVTTEDIACELVTAPTASSAGVYAYTAKVEYQNKEYTSTIYEEIADAPVNIMVPAGTTLNLFEDGSDGVITGCITISGNLNMGGGAICNPDGYAIIVEDGGSVTFSGGKVSGKGSAMATYSADAIKIAENKAAYARTEDGMLHLESLEFTAQQAASGVHRRLAPAALNSTYDSYVFCDTPELHTESNFQLNRVTERPDQSGLYAYTCDKGCGVLFGGRKVMKSNDGSENIEVEQDPDNKDALIAVKGITIDDSKNFSIPVGFFVPSVSYTRDLSSYANSAWGTLCLPFDIEHNEISGVTFYNMSNASATSITLNAITSGTIAAGTPVIYNRGESITSLSINKDQKTLLKSTSTDGSSSNGLTLKGTFEQTSIDSGYYLDAVNGKVCSAATYSAEHNGGKVTIPAFRAWFDGSIPSETKALDINIADSITSVQALHDAISGNVAIYDSNGQRLNNLRKGLNIVKYSNGETKKIIVK